MKLFKTTFSPFITAVLLLAFASFSHAQAEPKATVGDKNFEVVIQIVIGSGETSQQSALPQNLAAVTKHIKSNFVFTNYRLANTFIGRMADNGALEYKTVSNIFGRNSEVELPSFLDWSLVGVSGVSGTIPEVHIQKFRFGSRLPLKVRSVIADGGKEVPQVNYESIGLTLTRLGIPQNDPTLIGTINLPGADGTIFLILTIRPL